MLLLHRGHPKYKAMRRLGLIALQDWMNRAWYLLPRDSRCACCGQRHADRPGRSLCLDHTWLGRGRYFLTLLCHSCNSMKGRRRYIPVGAGRRWYPGMSPRTWGRETP